MEQKTLKILFFGDITGRQGRNALKSFLASSDLENTFIIANIENASHGFGLTKKNYNDLAEAGVNCFTSGNHIWDKKDIYEYIEDATNLIRPINYPLGTPGRGSQIFEFNGFKIGVINVSDKSRVDKKDLSALRPCLPVISPKNNIFKVFCSISATK